MGSHGGAIQEQKTGTLAREGSLYNLTFDEVQNQLGNLGKPLGSMNLDELLKSLWTSEAAQGSGLDSGTTDGYMQHGQLASGSSMNPLTLSGGLSKKTIDEVWRDMQQKKSTSITSQDRRTATLGEMTLEDFLMKAGVATESFPSEDNAMSGRVDSQQQQQQNTSQHGHWMQYQVPSVQQVQQPQQQHQHQNHQNNMMTGFAGYMAGHVVQQPVLDAGYTEAMVSLSPSSLMATSSDTQTQGRKRVASGVVVERTVERKQKRMIKNRESAARSRARKQAYTHELEIKVSHLEEENERLKRLHLCRTAEEHPEIIFLKVNFDENKPMCKSLNVKVLPYFHFYRGAEGQLESFSCSLAKFQKIKEAIQTHNTARCSIGPPKGIGDLVLETSSAPKDRPADSV